MKLEITIVEKKEPKNKKLKKDFNDFKEKAIKLGAQVARGAMVIGTKVTVRAATAGLVKDGDITETAKDIVDESGDIAEDYMRSLLSEPQKQKNIADEFKKTLAGLSEQLAPAGEGEEQKPLIFIIDELDRCKPLFALQILERIKHFMLVPNIHFILGVHLEQLKRSVKFAYGADIDATTYLQKFIHLTISNVDTTERENKNHIVKYIDHLKGRLEFNKIDGSLYILEFLRNISLKK